MGVFNWIRFVVTIAISVAVLAVSLIAFLDALRQPEPAYPYAEKKTRTFWLLVTGAGLVFSILGALQMIGVVLNLIAIAPAAIYWYDVRPEVSRYPRRSN